MCSINILMGCQTAVSLLYLHNPTVSVFWCYDAAVVSASNFRTAGNFLTVFVVCCAILPGKVT